MQHRSFESFFNASTHALFFWRIRSTIWYNRKNPAVKVFVGSTSGIGPRCDSQALHHMGCEGRVTYLGTSNLIAGAEVAGLALPVEFSQPGVHKPSRDPAS